MRAVAMRRPRGQGEDVLLLPVETLAANLGPAAALRHLVDDAAGVLVGPRLLSLREELKLRSDRRHDRPAGERIRVLVDAAVVGRVRRFLHGAISDIP